MTNSTHASPSGPMPVEEIWRALVDDQLLPWFQPIVSLKTGHTIAAEALARWQHPTLGVLAPISFVPAMEERGMIRELTELILEKSLYTCNDWEMAGYHLSISINLTLLSLNDKSLTNQLMQKTRLLGLMPNQLILEFPESTLRQHWDTAKTQLANLRAAGFGVAIDEYGIGLEINDKLSPSLFSSLKVDRTFTQGISKNHHLQSILRENLQHAKEHSLTITAIGAETQEDLDTLKEIGCDAVQGYIFSPPISSSDFIKWISTFKTR